MNETKNWKWATIVLGALLLAILACCVGAWFGGLIGLSFGRRLGRADYDHDMPYMMPQPGPQMPMPSIPAPELPNIPEMPRPNQRAWLGVYFRSVDQGAIIDTVIAGSPAEKAGLRANDVITLVDGRAVTANRPLDELIGSYAPGDTVELTVLRNGVKRTIEVRLGAQF